MGIKWPFHLVDLASGLIIGDGISAILLVGLVVKLVLILRSRVHTTKLNGPPSNNLFVGAFKDLAGNPVPELLFEQWAKEYGHSFGLHAGLGLTDLVIGDVKAVAHILSRDTFLYHQPGFTRVALDNLVGPGCLWLMERLYWTHDMHGSLEKES